MKLLFYCILLLSSLFGRDEVSLQLQWKHQFESAGFYMAKEKGYYDEVDLDVKFLEFNENTNIIDDVVSRKATYGITYSNLISSYLDGKPVVFLANILKYSPLALATQKEIISPKDLRGKKIMGIDSKISNISILMMIKQFGLNLQDVKSVKHTFDVKELIDGKVDAMVVFTTNETYKLDKAGFRYNLLKPSTYGIDFYEINLFTSKDEAKKNPDRTRRFKIASLKGWQYALNHIDETIEVILKKYNTQHKSKEHLKYEAIQIKEAILANIFKVGSIDKSKISLMAQSFKNINLVQNTDIDFNEFIFDNINDNKLNLSNENKEYLQHKKKIKLCVDPNLMPLEMIENGKHIGMSSEYMQIFQDKIRVPIELMPTKNWLETLEFSKEKKCDIVSLIIDTPQREQFLNFTKPYIKLSMVLATKINTKFIDNLEDLKGETIAIPKAFGTIYFLKSKYKNLNIVEVDSVQDGLQKVKDGKIFGYIGTLPEIGYIIQNEFVGELKVSGKFDEKIELSLGVRNDEPNLLEIFEMAIESISENKKQQIFNNWVSVKYENGVDYKLIRNILIFGLIVALLFLYRQYVLKKLNKQLTVKIEAELKKSYEKDEMILHQNKLASMGEMLANIAHQWKQPLANQNGILCNLEYDYLNVQLTDDKFQRYINEMEQLNIYMSDTIEDFRTFFSPTKESEVFSTKRLFKDVSKISSLFLKKHQLELIVDSLENITLNTYKSELIQVLLLLISNAKDAYLMGENQNKQIILSSWSDDEFTYLGVRDFAGGIDIAIKDKIFEPYFTTKHQSLGTGLGLYIVNTIVSKSLHGEVTFKNENNGANFLIKLKKQTIL